MSSRAETLDISFPPESCGISFEAFQNGQTEEAGEQQEKEDFCKKKEATSRIPETSKDPTKKRGRQKKTSKEGILSKKGKGIARGQSPVKITKRCPGRLSQVAKIKVAKRPSGWVPAPQSGKVQFPGKGQGKGQVKASGLARKEAIRKVHEGYVKNQIRLQKAKTQKDVTRNALSQYLQQGMNALTSLLQGFDKMNLK